MKVDELRDALFDFIQSYFAGADVRWSELSQGTKPQNPFISLKLGPLKRPQHYITDRDFEAQRNFIPTTAILTVQLFTHGREVVDEEGDSYFVNTAQADMVDFVNYMTSEYADEEYERLDISIRPEGDVIDATAVRDSNYEYRAKQDFVVSFMDESRGYAGISRENWSPTPSGGGTVELAQKEIMDVDPDKLNIEQSQEESEL